MSDPTPLVITFCFVASALTAGGMMLANKLKGADQTPPPLPAGKVIVWWCHPVDIIGAAIVFSIFFGLILLSFALPAPTTNAVTANALIFNIGFQMFLAAIVSVLALQRCSFKSWLGLKWPSWPWVFLIAPGCVLLMWVIFYVIEIMGYMEWMESIGVEKLQDTVQILQKSDDPIIVGLMAITAVFVAPICEEIIFRGYLYPVLKKFIGLMPALILSSVVFASAHSHLAVLLPLFILGALLVVVYEKTGSIWAPIAVHFCFNGATVALQLVMRVFDIPIEADL